MTYYYQTDIQIFRQNGTNMSTQIRGNKQIKSVTIENAQIANQSIELGKLKDGAELLKRDGSVAITGDLNLSNHTLKNIAAPVDANDAVRKADLDAATSGVVVNREVPAGLRNGVNVIYTLANVPNAGTEQIFFNGNLLNPGQSSDYVIDEDEITLAFAPLSDDVLLVNYVVDGVVINVDVQTSIDGLDSRISSLENSVQGGGAGALSELSDVTISSPSNNQILKYDGSKWVNGAAPSSFSGSYNDLSNKPSIPSPVKEVPSGSVNGENVTFVLSDVPAFVGTEQVFLNGLLQFAGETEDYTISGDTITFNSAPETGWKIVVCYFI